MVGTPKCEGRLGGLGEASLNRTHYKYRRQNLGNTRRRMESDVLGDGLVVDASQTFRTGTGAASSRTPRRDGPSGRRSQTRIPRATLRARRRSRERYARFPCRSPRRVYLHVGPKRDHERDAMSQRRGAASWGRLALDGAIQEPHLRVNNRRETPTRPVLGYNSHPHDASFGDFSSL